MLEFRHVASDKPQGTLLKRGRVATYNINRYLLLFILYAGIWKRIKCYKCLLKHYFLFFFSCSTGALLDVGPPGATNLRKKATDKNGKSLYQKIEMTRIKALNFRFRPFYVLVFTVIWQKKKTLNMR